jgi:copper chaperone CopZ
VHVDFEQKTAIAEFDPAKTNRSALIKAASDAGYPAAVKE